MEQKQPEEWEDQKKDGKTTSINSSSQRRQKETRGNNLKNNDTWIRAAKDQQKSKENGEGPRQKIVNPANTIQTTTTTYSIDGNDQPVYSQYTQEYAEDEGYSQYTQEYAEEGEIDSGYSTRS